MSQKTDEFVVTLRVILFCIGLAMLMTMIGSSLQR